jgi:hypothetical protein
MYCPVCKETRLEMAERQGVEIDYCPDCRGVWLDRGELDKIIERSAPEGAPAAAPRGGERSHGGQKPKKKDSLLKELFDF